MDPKNLKGVRLLIADDDEETLEILKMYVDKAGWDGTYVRTATAILRAINERCSDGDICFDAIIADVNYWNANDGDPKISGITAAREIRKVHPNVPIIFITAYTGSIIREEIRRVDGELVTKPFDFPDLMVRVAQLIYWHRLGKSRVPGDRRRMSINLTNYRRRSTDGELCPSPIITSVIEQVRETNDERRNN